MIRRCLLLFALLQLLYSGILWACTCAPLTTEDYDSHALIFVGEVEGTAGCGGNQRTHFVVTEALRGVSVDERVTVPHSARPSSSCALTFTPGDSWLIATDPGADYGLCSPGHRDPTDEELADITDALTD